MDDKTDAIRELMPASPLCEAADLQISEAAAAELSARMEGPAGAVLRRREPFARLAGSPLHRASQPYSVDRG